jgi:hypothetical protein
MSTARTERPRTERRSKHDATRSTHEATCSTCDKTLYIKLTRRPDGRLERTAYCASCDRDRDVTSNLARRAALCVAAAREVA